MKRILLIATGGTIACSDSENGLTPAFSAEQLVAQVPELERLCQFEALSLMAIDSTNMTPERMAEIARTIFDNYLAYDGFVVTHGTDTLGYTSAALSYMLPNLGKPVVVTGSQLAMEDMYTDARNNLSDAVRFAVTGTAGVFVAFDGRIIRGTRAVKMKTRSMDAFASVNADIVADIKLGRINFHDTAPSHPTDLNSKPRLRDNICEDVFLLKVAPGIKPDILTALMRGYRGVVIESFGIGGIPGQLLDGIKELIDHGVAVVVSSQCLEEGVDLGVYAVGQDLARCDVIYAGDMNSEALVMKLMWALANCESLPKIKQFMETPVCGDRCH